MLATRTIFRWKKAHQYNEVRRISPEVAKMVIQSFDFILILFCSMLSFVIYFVALYGAIHVWGDYIFLGAVGGLAFVYATNWQGGYGINHLQFLKNQSKISLISCCLTPLIITLVVFVLKTGDELSRGWLVIWWMLAGVLIVPTRMFVLSMLTRWSGAGFTKSRAVIISSGDLAEEFHSWISKQETYTPIEIIGTFDRRVITERLAGLMEPPTLADLRACFDIRDIDVIFVTADETSEVDIDALLSSLSGIPIEVVVLAPPLIKKPAQIQHGTYNFYGPYPSTTLKRNRLKEWSYILKRLMDIMIAAVALVIMAPVLLLISIAIKLDSPGPVLFRQGRFGFFNQPINVLKFRSMYVDLQDHQGARRTVRNDPRVTSVGRFIRKTSLDELPQLFNILMGHMSIIGPRAHPISMQVDGDYYYKAVRNYADRHRVKPGLTGWAQVNGSRGEVATLKQASKRIELDLYYIENWSFWLDVQILLRTVVIVLRGENAY